MTSPSRFNLAVTVTIAIALVVVAVGLLGTAVTAHSKHDYLPAVDPGINHCPEHKDFEDEKQVLPRSYVPPVNALVCVKAGSPESNPSGVGNTGWFLADGHTLKHYMRHAGLTNKWGNVRRVSYVIVRPLDPGQPVSNRKASVVAIGPKGDPWYRFVARNRGQERATCFIRFTQQRKTKRIVLQPGQGFRTGWRWVESRELIRMSCWSGGDKVFYRAFRGAPAGWYGSLYPVNTGYFTLRGWYTIA